MDGTTALRELFTVTISLLATGGTGGMLIKALFDRLSGKAKAEREKLSRLQREAEAWRKAVHVLEESLHDMRVKLVRSGVEPPPWPEYDRPVVTTE